MAYRRSITARAKLFYEQQRVSLSSFSHIHRDNHENPPHYRPISNNPQIPNYFQRRLFGTGNNLGTCHGFNDRRFSIPSACGPAEKKIEIMTDVPPAEKIEDVLGDKAVEVAAQAAPIDYVHTFGFNWSKSIRSGLLPLLINQIKSSSKFTDMSAAAVAEGQIRMKELFKEYGVTLFTPLKGLLISGPIFCETTVKNMAEKVPSKQIQPNMNVLRPLSPHLSIYKPQPSSTFSIFNRISGAFLATIVYFSYVCVKIGLICFTYENVYQFFFYSSKLIPISAEIAALALSYHILFSLFGNIKR